MIRRVWTSLSKLLKNLLIGGLTNLAFFVVFLAAVAGITWIMGGDPVSVTGVVFVLVLLANVLG